MDSAMDVKKTTCCSGKSFFGANIGVAGLEPAASWSRTKHATDCATPRYQRIKIILLKEEKMVCKFCGNEASPADKFCKNCGLLHKKVYFCGL